MYLELVEMLLVFLCQVGAVHRLDRTEDFNWLPTAAVLTFSLNNVSTLIACSAAILYILVVNYGLNANWKQNLNYAEVKQCETRWCRVPKRLHICAIFKHRQLGNIYVLWIVLNVTLSVLIGLLVLDRSDYCWDDILSGYWRTLFIFYNTARPWIPEIQVALQWCNDEQSSRVSSKDLGVEAGGDRRIPPMG
jgi:hypothetical protein